MQNPALPTCPTCKGTGQVTVEVLKKGKKTLENRVCVGCGGRGTGTYRPK